MKKIVLSCCAAALALLPLAASADTYHSFYDPKIYPTGLDISGPRVVPPRGLDIYYCDPYDCYFQGLGISPRVYEQNGGRYFGFTPQPGMRQTGAGLAGVDCRVAGEMLAAQSVDSCEAAGGTVIPSAASFTTACEIGAELAMTASPAACARLGGSLRAQ